MLAGERIINYLRRYAQRCRLIVLPCQQGALLAQGVSMSDHVAVCRCALPHHPLLGGDVFVKQSARLGHASSQQSDHLQEGGWEGHIAIHGGLQCWSGLWESWEVIRHGVGSYSALSAGTGTGYDGG